MKKILFVCLGNICRSPAAEGIMRQKLLEQGLQEGVDFEVDSAGTGSWHVGEGPDVRSQRVCLSHGIDISRQKARQLRPEDGEKYDYLFGMDLANVDDMKRIIPGAFHDRIYLFDKVEVNDPYYGIGDGFEIMFQQLEQAAVRRINCLSF